ncbi:hypothetical protein CANCADRAFT_57627 [Tortispora caseinolytica NRRL Y-17796]|uniref:RNA polymerase II degradation factor 1 n=1 Tax=Tortispora caseinolytica NRRL Y-17796 TaxID=767744 RepID=A0A1E4TI01_9ASCO|nr:hypothetical protein CANCADRAFT_57627 [Tortispora caseinolytica NRRL Y-17796]
MAASVEALKAIVPDWSEEDLLFVLQDVSGDVDEAAMRITSGQAQRWNPVDNKHKPVKTDDRSSATTHSNSNLNSNVSISSAHQSQARKPKARPSAPPASAAKPAASQPKQAKQTKPKPSKLNQASTAKREGSATTANASSTAALAASAPAPAPVPSAPTWSSIAASAISEPKPTPASLDKEPSETPEPSSTQTSFVDDLNDTPSTIPKSSVTVPAPWGPAAESAANLTESAEPTQNTVESGAEPAVPDAQKPTSKSSQPRKKRPQKVSAKSSDFVPAVPVLDQLPNTKLVDSRQSLVAARKAKSEQPQEHSLTVEQNGSFEDQPSENAPPGLSKTSVMTAAIKFGAMSLSNDTGSEDFPYEDPAIVEFSGQTQFRKQPQVDKQSTQQQPLYAHQQQPEQPQAFQEQQHQQQQQHQQPHHHQQQYQQYQPDFYASFEQQPHGHPPIPTSQQPMFRPGNSIPSSTIATPGSTMSPSGSVDNTAGQWGYNKAPQTAQPAMPPVGLPGMPGASNGVPAVNDQVSYPYGSMLLGHQYSGPTHAPPPPANLMMPTYGYSNPALPKFGAGGPGMVGDMYGHYAGGRPQTQRMPEVNGIHQNMYGNGALSSYSHMHQQTSVANDAGFSQNQVPGSTRDVGGYGMYGADHQFAGTYGVSKQEQHQPGADVPHDYGVSGAGQLPRQAQPYEHSQFGLPQGDASGLNRRNLHNDQQPAKPYGRYADRPAGW